MEGGADTGFRHVEPEQYPARLLRFKREGRRSAGYRGTGTYFSTRSEISLVVIEMFCYKYANGRSAIYAPLMV